ADALQKAAMVNAALHGDFGPLTTPPATGANTSTRQHDATSDAPTPPVSHPHAPTAGEIAVDHLADTVGHDVGGTLGAVIGTLGHLFDGELANAAAANPAALSAAEANPQGLAHAVETAAADFSAASPLDQDAAVSAAMHGDLAALMAQAAPYTTGDT